MKNCGLRFITNLPLSRIRQSATTKQYHDAWLHTSTNTARRLTTALHPRGSTFQPKKMVYCVMSVTPSADPQRSSVHTNNIETWTAINDIIAPDECQAIVGPTEGFMFR
jgi:hypothetical protein